MARPGIDELRALVVSKLEQAVTHHQAGRLDEAEQIYRDILQSQPEHSDAWHLLGVIAAQRADPEQAVGLIEKAVRLDPEVAEYQDNLGKALRAQGKLDAAIDAFRRSLAIRFDNDTLDILAQTLFAHGPVEQAVECYLRALQLKPDDVRARAGLVSLLRTVRPSGSWAELEQQLLECYRSAEIVHQHLAGITANQLKYRYAFSNRPPLTTPDSGAFLDSLSRDPLILALLAQTVNVDFEIERFLTEMRRHFLLERHEGPAARTEHVALLGALAQQCFNNEYVFNLDAEEAAAVEKLSDSLCGQLAHTGGSIQSEIESAVLRLACYFPLASLRCASELRSLGASGWSPLARTLIERTLMEPLEELAIAQEIDSLGEIGDATSKSVRTQYEENPYPRWLTIGHVADADLASTLRARYPSFNPPECLHENPRILIAGCGTGKEAIEMALGNRNSQVFAVDLSRRSLAYAVRMARKFGVTNVRFIQGDILSIGNLSEHFDVISSVGVLHHLADPMAGWRVLVERLAPRGLMRVALYSEAARRPLTAAKKEIERRGLKPAADDIRRFRTLVLSGAVNGELAEFSTGREFYSLGECRDLLFHVKEHLFTPGQIGGALRALDLDLVGFDLSNLNVPQNVIENFRSDGNAIDVTACEQIEQLYPRAFLSMYRFWCQKK